MGGIPLLILATQETQCVGKSGGISPVIEKFDQCIILKSNPYYTRLLVLPVFISSRNPCKYIAHLLNSEVTKKRKTANITLLIYTFKDIFLRKLFSISSYFDQRCDI
jgi:hypothetical protein